MAAFLRLLTKFIDLVLYGNFWIALAALCMGLQTQYLLTGTIYFSTFAAFLFTSTLFLYAIHRIVGLDKVSAFQDQGRYLVISTFKSHIIFYALVSAFLAVYLYWQLSMALKIGVIIPGVISIAYVVPFLAAKKRLRDLNYVKIFMIVVSWAWVTVVLSARELNMASMLPVVVMTLERALFVFAITIPFDIRDLQIDSDTEVKTIPSSLGVGPSIRLALCCLLISFLFIWFNHHIDVYEEAVFIAFFISYLSTALLIWFSPKQKHDYYFTGLLDGTMILQFVLVYYLS